MLAFQRSGTHYLTQATWLRPKDDLDLGDVADVSDRDLPSFFFFFLQMFHGFSSFCWVIDLADPMKGEPTFVRFLHVFFIKLWGSIDDQNLPVGPERK